MAKLSKDEQAKLNEAMRLDGANKIAIAILETAAKSAKRCAAISKETKAWATSYTNSLAVIEAIKLEAGLKKVVTAIASLDEAPKLKKRAIAKYEGAKR
jgi:hypothetical protein